MSNSIIWFNRWLKIFTLIATSTIFIGCVDDQDPTTTSPDSPAVKTNEADGKEAGTRRKPEPYTMHDSTVTRLALRLSEINQYNHGKQFIDTLPNNIDSAGLIERKYGVWYEIKNLPPNFNASNKERVANNIYGYLIYHDMVIRHPAGPHKLFLQWFRTGAMQSVTVWIHPAPEFSKETPESLLLSDPPRPKVPPPPVME